MYITFSYFFRSFNKVLLLNCLIHLVEWTLNCLLLIIYRSLDGTLPFNVHCFARTMYFEDNNPFLDNGTNTILPILYCWPIYDIFEEQDRTKGTSQQKPQWNVYQIFPCGFRRSLFSRSSDILLNFPVFRIPTLHWTVDNGHFTTFKLEAER